MSDGSRVFRLKPLPGRPWMRLAAIVAVCVMMLVIWASQIYLTRAFGEDHKADAIRRATLYAGAIQGSMQRHKIVPLLLARDPVLIAALRTGQYAAAEARLTDFREEIGAGSLFLLNTAGTIVAASDDRPRAEFDGANFTAALTAPGTEFTMLDDPAGGFTFHYARPVTVDEDSPALGVIVVTVDLGAYEEGWRRAGIKVVVSDSDGEILLASDPAWRRNNIADVLAPESTGSRVRQAIRTARSSIGEMPYIYIDDTPYLQTEVPLGFRNWRLTFLSTLEDVKARVNSVLSLIVMVMALLLALGFYMLSRRTRAESQKFRRESAELRALNRRLSDEIAARQRLERNLKEAEQSLEQASKLAALGQMSAAVSHELNQPLAAMRTYLAGARLLLQRRRFEEAIASFQRIDDLINRMGGITRQLKSYAHKGDRLQLEPVDLRGCVREALALMAPQLAKTPVAITTSMPAEPVMVRADPIRTEQIVVNLLRNAIDAVRGKDERWIRILLVHGESVLLSVEDNGMGLKDPDKLFEPFYTTKKPGEGLGLGLAISAGFAAELGGRLLARNAPDGGAVFELVLPPAATPAENRRVS